MARASSSESQEPVTETFSPEHVVGAQRLAEPAFVMGDQVRGGGEDVAGRAVIALQPDHRGAGKVVLEAQDVVDLGAAPAVDRLVVVADAADVFGAALSLPRSGRGVAGEAAGRGLAQRSAVRALIPASLRSSTSPGRGEGDECSCARPLRQQPQPEILRDVGVLIFVDQDEFEARLILAQHFGVLAEQPDAFEQQIAEIGGVEDFQPLLKRLVEFQPLAVGEGARLRRRHLLGREPAVLPAVDQHGQHARRPALLVDVLGFEQLLEQPDLVVDVEDGEIGLEPDQLGMAAQDFHADRMEGAEPRHALDHVADDLADAVLHLARRLVGEGDGEDFARPGAAGGEDVGDAHGEHARLAGAGAGQHQHRAVERLDREPLLGIEPGEIGAPPPPRRARARQCRRARAPAGRAGSKVRFKGSAKAAACQ